MEHPWDLTPTEAVQLQKELASRVDVATPLNSIQTLACADVSFDRGGEFLYAAVVVVDYANFDLVERVGLAAPARFPYVPGLLSFREAPALLEAFGRLKARPDAVLCDGQGIAHPRRLGIASHLGLWLDLPTVGCAKSLLCGTFEEPGEERGDRSPLVHRGEVIGTVLRTRRRVSPVFVSPGHRCDLEGAERLVLESTTRYRLPIPIRMAHDYVNQVRRSAKAGQPMPD
ncbi:deoxyribonuclease V [Tundrisphaera sp. TA3]|uniref:deoxyribonuclease V n=1 Tax=Tundrisphaera sp. TA3 TaxID=3435775 RepID=UPI003EC0AB6C